MELILLQQFRYERFRFLRDRRVRRKQKCIQCVGKVQRHHNCRQTETWHKGTRIKRRQEPTSPALLWPLPVTISGPVPGRAAKCTIWTEFSLQGQNLQVLCSLSRQEPKAEDERARGSGAKDESGKTILSIIFTRKYNLVCRFSS